MPGPWIAIRTLLEPEEIPDIPIDTATLSRDPAVGAAYAAGPLVWHGPFSGPPSSARGALAAARSGRVGAPTGAGD